MGYFKGILPLLLILDCIHQTIFVQGRIIGCHGFGSVATDESDRPLLEKLQPLLAKELIEFTEEECQAYMLYISQPVNRRNESRDERLVWHQNRTDIQGHAECNRRGWLMSGFPAWCHCFYEAEGKNCEEVSHRSSRPPKGAIVYLLYGDEKYFWMLLDAIEHLHLSFLDKFPSHSILVFHSANFRNKIEPGIHTANYRGEVEPGISYLDMIRAKSNKVTLIEVGREKRLWSTSPGGPPPGISLAKALRFPISYPSRSSCASHHSTAPSCPHLSLYTPPPRLSWTFPSLSRISFRRILQTEESASRCQTNICINSSSK